jgi:hypothetical protein
VPGGEAAGGQHTPAASHQPFTARPEERLLAGSRDVREQASRGEIAEGTVIPFVVSVSVTSVYEADASSSFCPFGQVMSLGGGWTVRLAVTLPFLPELNVPLALTGPLTVVLFWALGFEPPLLTQTQVACALPAQCVVDELACAEPRFLEVDGQRFGTDHKRRKGEAFMPPTRTGSSGRRAAGCSGSSTSGRRRCPSSRWRRRHSRTCGTAGVELGERYCALLRSASRG